jgi:hypothetical protein
VFGAKIVLLLVSLWILRPEHRQLIAFPLLGLFAGTIGSDPVIISEAHFAAGLLWPLLFAANGATRGTVPVLAVIVLCGLLAPFSYESFLLFGPILMLGAAWGTRADHRLKRASAVAAGTSGLVSTTVSALAVLYPRDPGNLGSFSSALVNVVRDALLPGAEVFVPFLLCVVAFVALAVPLVTRGARLGSAAAAAVLIPSIAFLVLFPICHFFFRSPTWALTQSYFGRSFACVLIPAAVALLYLLHARWSRPLHAAFLATAFTVLPALSAGQVAWQLMLTGIWARSAAVVADEVRIRQGRVACEDIPQSSVQALGITPAQFRDAICHWTAAPLSLIVPWPSPPQSVVFAEDRFRPFEIGDGSALPSMRFVRVSLDRLRANLDADAALRFRHRYSFGLDGTGNRFLNGGFSHLESWGVWTDGSVAALRLCGSMPADAAALRLSLGVGAHLPGEGASLRVRAAFGERWSTSWTFSPGEAGPTVREADIPAAAMDTGCLEIRFLIEDPRSPQELGTGSDPRKLGLALLWLELSPP